MAGDRVAAVGVADRGGGAGPHVGAALFLGHRHTRGNAGLGGGHRQLWIVGAAGEQWLVGLRQFGVVAQGRYDGVGHGDRADVAGFGRPDSHLGGANDVGARAIIGPGRGVQSVADRGAHQFVIGGVVLDLVDAIPVAVVGVQDRAVAVGEIAPALGGGPAGQRTKFGDFVEAPATALADQGFDQHR